MSGTFWLKEVVLTKKQKNLFLHTLDCSETDMIFTGLMNELKYLAPAIENFKTQDKTPASKQQEEIDKIRNQANKLYKSLANLKHSAEIIDQLYRLNCLIKYNLQPNVAMMDSLEIVSISLNDAYNEIDPTGISKATTRAIVRTLIPFLNKHNFPTGKSSSRFNELLRITCEVLSADVEPKFEHTIKVINDDLKREKLSQK